MVSKVSDEEYQELAGGGVEFCLIRLSRINLRLRIYGLSISLITSANLFYIFVLLFLIRLYSNLPLFSTLVFPLGCAVVVFLIDILYEVLRKEGDALFEEISDEFQWNVRTGNAKYESDYTKETSSVAPPINARVILRAFARASDLPLVPGKFGPAIYVVFNLAICFMQFWLMRVFQ